MKLVNVRLRGEEASMVEALRGEGVALSQLVRDAIRTEYGRRRRKLGPRDVDALLAETYARFPEPASGPGRKLDVHDRRAFRDAVGRRVRAETRR